MAIRLGSSVIDGYGRKGEVVLIIGYKGGRKIAVARGDDGLTFRADTRDLMPIVRAKHRAVPITEETPNA